MCADRGPRRVDHSAHARLNIVSFALMARRPRRAALLAAIGPFLFIGPVSADQLGLFSAIAPPFRSSVVEAVAALTQLAILFVAVRLRRVSAAT
jgi:hypothetical protein